MTWCEPKEEVPCVAIIVLNWNGWRDTLQCLQSLEQLNYPNYFVVVVDNGSTDDSVQRIRQAYPEITLIETGKNLGFSGGNNVGIRYALEHGAEYVWLLNNDTVVDAHALTAMITLAESDAQIGAVGSVIYEMNTPEKIQVWGGGKVHLWIGIERLFTRPVSFKKIHYIAGASLLIRRAVVEHIGLLDEKFFMYWEDADYGFRIRKAGWKLVVASDSTIWHKGSSSFQGRSTLLIKYFHASAVPFFMKYALFPFFPLFIGSVGRLIKRVACGDVEGMKSVIRGLYSGIFHTNPKTSPPL